MNLDQLVFADARQLVTCEILDAQGNVVSWSKDSIESYTYRATHSSIGAQYMWLNDMMDFCDSAYNYFK